MLSTFAGALSERFKRCELLKNAESYDIADEGVENERNCVKKGSTHVFDRRYALFIELVLSLVGHCDPNQVRVFRI